MGLTIRYQLGTKYIHKWKLSDFFHSQAHLDEYTGLLWHRGPKVFPPMLSHPQFYQQEWSWHDYQGNFGIAKYNIIPHEGRLRRIAPRLRIGHTVHRLQPESNSFTVAVGPDHRTDQQCRNNIPPLTLSPQTGSGCCCQQRGNQDCSRIYGKPTSVLPRW